MRGSVECRGISHLHHGRKALPSLASAEQTQSLDYAPELREDEGVREGDEAWISVRKYMLRNGGPSGKGRDG